MFSLYRFKPQLAESLQPVAAKLAARGLTADRVTVFSAAVSLAVGLLLCAGWPFLFWLLPLCLLLRVVLETADGVMAREAMQESARGAYLNEVGKLFSEAVLWLPVALVLPGGGLAVAVLVWLAAAAETVGLMGLVHGSHGRRYDGPMGKWERALLLAVLAVWYAWAGSLNVFATALVWLAVLATGYTVWLRVQGGLKV